MILDVDTIRADFPILQTQMRGKPFIYLDSAASSLKPKAVLDEALQYYQEYGVNIHRGVYEYSDIATRLYQDAREKIAGFINSPSDSQVIFTHGSTEASNLLAYSWGNSNLNPGDVILCTKMEHHSTLVPWQEAARRRGARLEFLPFVPGTVELDEEAFEKAFHDKVKILVLSAMSNVSGYIPPLNRLIELAHAHGALAVLDGAQYVSHHPCDVQLLDCDFLYFSGHKMLAPTGIGCLWGKKEYLESLEPFMFGGDMIQEVRDTEATYQGIPERFEAGTPHIAGGIAFGRAIDYLENLGMQKIAAHETQLMNYCIQKAQEYPWLELYTPQNPQARGSIFSFNIKNTHPHDVGTILDSQGIAVRTGFHCAMPLMAYLGISGTVRASFYLYTRTSDIDALFEGLVRAQALFN